MGAKPSAFFYIADPGCIKTQLVNSEETAERVRMEVQCPGIGWSKCGLNMLKLQIQRMVRGDNFHHFSVLMVWLLPQVFWSFF